MDTTVRIWDVASGKTLHALLGHKDNVTAIAISKDGKRIASASEDATVRLWDADTGKELAIFRGHKDAVMSIAFSPDGQRIISGSKGVLRIWQCESNILAETATHLFSFHFRMRTCCDTGVAVFTLGSMPRPNW